jgi:hypothetical protein
MIAANLSLWGVEEIREPQGIGGGRPNVMDVNRETHERAIILGTKFYTVLGGICNFGSGACDFVSLFLSVLCVSEIASNPSAARGLGIASAVVNAGALSLARAATSAQNQVRRLEQEAQPAPPAPPPAPPHMDA